MTKSFSFRELLARIDSLARRSSATQTTELRFADLMIDTIQRRVFHSGRCVSLTRSEFLLLEQLMQHAGRPLPRKILEDTIWGSDTPVNRGVLDTLINSLRGKLDAPLRQSLIKTIRGLGYCLQNTPETMQEQNT
jgi:DNA-binding response OmpR family regulator